MERHAAAGELPVEMLLFCVTIPASSGNDKKKLPPELPACETVKNTGDGRLKLETDIAVAVEERAEESRNVSNMEWKRGSR